MIDLKKYNSPVHKISFEEGEVFIKRLPATKAFKAGEGDEIGSTVMKTVLYSLCDEDGKEIGLTIEDVQNMDSDMVSTIYLECQIINAPKKKIDSVPQS